MQSTKKSRINSEILLVTDDDDEQAHVRELLVAEYGNILSSASAAGALALFKQYHPVLVILAFETVSAAEAFYLSLYRDDHDIYRAPHKTLLLCRGSESRQAYELCINGILNDYVADRPLFDRYRLSLSVAQALRRFHVEQGSFWLSQHVEHLNAEVHRFERFIAQKIEQGDVQRQLTTESFQDFTHQLGEDLMQLEQRLEVMLNVKGFPHSVVHRASSKVKDFRQQSLQAGRERHESLLEHTDDWRQQMDQQREIFKQSLPPSPHRSDVIEVLLVDDDDLYRETLITMLNSDKLHVMGVSDGRSALHSLLVYKPDVILLNYQMPDMDGLTVLRALRNDQRSRSIPVIMLDSNSSRQVMNECVEAGVHLFIVKPGDRKTFLSHIDKALQQNS